MSPKKTSSRSVEAKLVVALAAVFAICIWWLLSEREPTQKEMTLAYRKYVVATNADRSAQALVDLRLRAHAIELIKQRCDKLDKARYRCEATVQMDDRPLAGGHPAENALYMRDAKGWQFETIPAD